MRKQAFVCVTALALLSLSVALTESRSILDSLPGAAFFRNFSKATMDTMNSMVNDTLDIIKNRVSYMAVNENDDPDVNKNVSEIIRSRGYLAEDHAVLTKDGYIIIVQRIINPLVKPEDRAKLQPVIMWHGLMSSSVDFVINSIKVRPEIRDPEKDEENESNEIDMELEDTQEHPNSIGFYLANRGYDVFLGNSRGNTYGLRHIRLNSLDPRFWDFTFDEQIKYDLPDTIEYVQKLTNHTKVGYVGHSQGTVMMFGLLSDKPEYADIVEPFVALAPVAFVDHIVTPVKYLTPYTPMFQHVNMPFAESNAVVKFLAPLVCGPKIIRKEICANLLFLGVGFNMDELDDSRMKAYLTHMPSGTSVKNVAHYGQEVLSRRFSHFDHGILGNQIKYGQTRAPDYDLGKIRSKSIALFSAENDWLAAPKDVARLKAALKVQPFVAYNISEIKPKWNHIDFLYAKHAGQIINTRVFKVFDHFRKNPTNP